LTISKVKGVMARKNEKFQELVAIHEEEATSAAGKHKLWLESRMEKAQEVIDRGLGNTKDLRLATENAWKISDRVYPKPKEQPAPPQGEQHYHANLEFNQVVLDMGKQFMELKQVLATQDPNKHVKTGAEALPRAISAEVTPPEAVNVKIDLESDE
jgi:hypothetical protein